MDGGDVGRRLSRETLIGIGSSALGLAAMASDHLLGDEPGLEDPAAFAVSAAIVLGLAGALFRLVVPRARAAPERAARPALVCGVLAVLTIAVVFLGPPFPLAGAAVALGLLAWAAGRRAAATIAVALGAIALGVATAFYVAEALGAA